MATLGATAPVSPPPTPALHGETTKQDDATRKEYFTTDKDTRFDGGLNVSNPLNPRLPESPSITPGSSPTPKPATIFRSENAMADVPSATPKPDTLPSVVFTEHTKPGTQTKEKPKRRSNAGTEDDHMDSFPRLSKPVELLRSEYDVVVIGSGYGGGVAASRMARTGQSVCVLERGRERWPGEYPVKTADALKDMHISGTLAPGNLKGKMVDGGDPTGMYHLIFGRGQNAVVCNGLGGTSLINANVFMEADKKTLAMKAWPPQIRDNVHELDKYYKKAEAVLEPETYPEDWPKLPKLEMLQKQAEALGYGDRFMKVRQTTRFRDGPNGVGVEMSASELTGQDVTGVNDGSKNSTLVTYIADAWNWGAEMFCECEVRYIQKLPENKGYLVFYAWHGRNRGAFKANLHGDLMWVHAKKAVFLGAGSIASTEILLRSKAMGLEMSTEVGQNMSGNGDILAFGYNTDEKVNAIGRPVPSKSNPVGPCITGVIDCRENNDNPLDGFVIEEGTVPAALAHVLQFMLDCMPGSVEPNEPLHKRTQAAFARYGSRFLGPYFKGGALERTQVYLIMSHDSNQAVLSLKDDKPVLEFLGVARSNHTKYLNGLLAKATQAVGGTLVQNPFFALMGQQVTVHPIGGACMAHDNTGNTGVTNHVGEVFVGDGPETHDGLIVTDAAVIPTALGANPFATITALAERSVEAYALSKGLTISTERNGIIDLFGEPAHPPLRSMPPSQDSSVLEEQGSMTMASDVVSTAKAMRASGFGFTEVMTGFVHHDPNLKTDERETYELAYRTARSRCESARFFLSVQSFDVASTLAHDQHRSMLTGTFACASIPGSPFMVQRGEFNLFVLNSKAPGTRNLTYDFDMKGIDGRKLHFHGYKVVDSSVALSPRNFWRATTTLYVSISEHVPGMCDDLDDEDAWRQGRVLAKGIMHIQPSDFVSEILTMTPTGSSLLKKALSATSFLTFFTRKSLGLLLAPLARLQYPSQSYSGYINDTPPSEVIPVYASDKVCTRLLVWEPTAYPNNDPSQTRNLFMIPGAAVDHQIYALPTIPFNAVNYFTRAGYRVYITVHRIGQLAVAENLHTTYDARLDLLACLETIRARHGPHPVYTIAHCMGSVAFASGLLDGTIPASYILGVTASQVFMNPVWGPANMAKVLAGPVPMDKLYTTLARSTWFSCSTSPDDTIVQRALNQVLRLYPQSRREMCANAACHRCSLVFGRCWNHENLNEATHRQIDRFFGGVNMRLLNLLMKMGYEGHAMSNAPEYTPLDTPENVERLRGVPFLLFVGRDNAVLSVESTERTYETLTDAFGDGSQYKRRVVPGYGHLDPWMGRNAWKDVYPFVREEVDRVVRGEGYKFVEPEDKWKRMVGEGTVLY